MGALLVMGFNFATKHESCFRQQFFHNGQMTMTAAKQYAFILHFNFKQGDATWGRAWAEEKRDGALACPERLFGNKARFSCIAGDVCGNALTLRGHVHAVRLTSPCTQAHAKRLLGKHSSCKHSHFGDMVNLCRFLHVDRELMATGRLTASENSKSFSGDPGFVVRVPLDSIDRNDFESDSKHDTKDESLEDAGGCSVPLGSQRRDWSVHGVSSVQSERVTST